MGFSTESRRTILERDRGCVVGFLLGRECAGPLHCHHIRPEWARPDLADDPSNGAAVCELHHPVWESLQRVLVRHHPVWESLQRVLVRHGRRSCRHRHRSREARELCERKMNRAA